MSTLVQEINSTNMAEPYVTFANNVIRQMIIDPSFRVLATDSFTVSSSFVNELYNLNTKM